MPAAYAHSVFGRSVTANLAQSRQNIIKKYNKAFQLGLQGPDFLFFFEPYRENQITKIGHKLHKKKAATYLKKIIPVIKTTGMESPQGAYMMGLICHFMLDSSCHPYINKMAKELEIGHIELESEYERYLLLRDEKIPQSYPMWKLIPCEFKLAQQIQPLYPWVSTVDLWRSMCSFRAAKYMLEVGNPVKYKMIMTGTQFFKTEKEIQAHMIFNEKRMECTGVLGGILERQKMAVMNTIAILESFIETVEEDKPLDPRFYMNFSGK